MTRLVPYLSAVVVVMGGVARGEVFVLKNEGRISGELVNKDESPRKSYIVKTEDGGRITLAKGDVKQVLRPQESEYEQIAPTYPDTVEGQAELAEWCRQNQLAEKRKLHLARVIELDPNHKLARRALGFLFVDGQWVTDSAWREKNGFKFYKGAWRTPQEIELMERRRKDSLAEQQWSVKLRQWRSALEKADRDRAEKIKIEIESVADPYAAKTLVSLLAGEKRQEYRYWYIEALGKIATFDALNALTKYSLEDDDVEIRYACLERLAKHKNPVIVKAYVQMLRSKDNRMVNRAAVGLSYMGDKTAIGPLIDALVTTHKFIIPPSNPGAITGSFQKPGSTGSSFGNSTSGLSMGGNKPKVIQQDVLNKEVHATLLELVGREVDFSYNVKEWRRWLASQSKPATQGGGRRD